MDVEMIIREYITKSLHMSLATSKGDEPWVTEVHFTYDEQLNLYWRSLIDRRHSQEIMLNPRVAGNIVKQHNIDESPHAIYFEGRAELIEDESQYDKLFPLFKKRLQATEDIVEDAKKADGHKFFKVTVSKWYAFGRFGTDKNTKHQLDWNQ